MWQCDWLLRNRFYTRQEWLPTASHPQEGRGVLHRSQWQVVFHAASLLTESVVVNCVFHQLLFFRLFVRSFIHSFIHFFIRVLIRIKSQPRNAQIPVH